MSLKVERVPLATVVPDPANARAHGQVNLDAIAGSLRRFGQVEPLVVQRGSRRLIAGHGRLTAMRKLGWAEADIVEIDCDDVTATALGIALNRAGELAEWDLSALDRTLQSLKASGNLDGVGFTKADIAKVQRDLARQLSAHELEDDGPGEVPEHPVAQPGDVFVLGRHRLMCGDSTSSADVAQLLHGAKPGIMVTDPPYGVNYDPSWRKRAGLGETQRTGKVENDDRVDWTAAWSLFEGAVAYVWHAGVYTADVAQQLAAAGLRVRQQIVWAKPRLVIGRSHYHWQHEPAWVAGRDGADDKWVRYEDAHESAMLGVREGAGALWEGDRKQTTLWQIDVETRGVDGATRHGTQKPVECMGRAIRNHAFEEVYEPFSGSGTTLVACERLGRRCFAMEISPGYVDVAVGRWERLTGLKASLMRPGT